MQDLEQLVRKFDPERIIEREQACGVQFGPFHRARLLERAPGKVRRNLELARLRPDLVGMPRQGFSGPDTHDAPPANLRAAINATTTETNLWDPGLWALIPAFDMKPGKVYQVEFGGVIGTTGTPAISFRARCGTNNSAPPTGTDLGVGPTVTMEGVTAQPFYGEFEMIVRSIGVAASGATVTGNGFVLLPGAAASAGSDHCLIGGAVPATVDHTVNQGLAVSVIWGTSNASNTITPQWTFFRSLN
jgi:hypothetical protein